MAIFNCQLPISNCQLPISNCRFRTLPIADFFITTKTAWRNWQLAIGNWQCIDDALILGGLI
ncbi:MAG: hypothetical protein LC775_17080, partial [Acidobacteria bacterium]|nr:hypothetical protein [Acidobacteriota bacterium]